MATIEETYFGKWRHLFDSYIQLYGENVDVVHWIPIGEYEIIVEDSNGVEYLYNDVTGTIQNITNRDAVEEVYSEERFYRELSHAIYSRMLYVGVTQEDLAYEIGVTQATVSNYVNGVSVPNAYTLYLIAKVLGCTVHDFMKFVEM